jgi:two-component system CitB family response regulator
MNTPIEVLIVEDDIRIAEIHRRFTEKIDGFKVIGTATNGEQAMEWLEAIQPQLVLLDVYLPDMKGVELVKFIRAQFQHVDIIMITAAAEVEIVQQALRGGVADYIVKPLTFERFKRSLENYKKMLIELNQTDKLTVDQIENLWNGPTQDSGTDISPKGIDQLTLERIMTFITDMDKEGITAEGLSMISGVSRSTARRYLEYLISQNQIYAELIYGNVGRPERRYFKK